MIGQVGLRLIFGMALSWCLAPRSEITSGFFRIQLLLTLAVSSLVGVSCILDRSGESSQLLSGLALAVLAGAIAVEAYLGSILWTLERRAAGTWVLWQILGLAGCGVLGSSASLATAWGGWRGLNLLSELASGWLMGGVLCTMLLGHWYLTATGMKLAPLIQLNRCVVAAAGLRSVLALIGIWNISGARLGTIELVWLVLRWAGLIGPLILSLLVIRILRYRNTQSATGVLYASTILVFMGETAALLLSRSQDFGFWL